MKYEQPTAETIKLKLDESLMDEYVDGSAGSSKTNPKPPPNERDRPQKA